LEWEGKGTQNKGRVKKEIDQKKTQRKGRPVDKGKWKRNSEQCSKTSGGKEAIVAAALQEGWGGGGEGKMKHLFANKRLSNLGKSRKQRVSRRVRPSVDDVGKRRGPALERSAK